MIVGRVTHHEYDILLDDDIEDLYDDYLDDYINEEYYEDYGEYFDEVYYDLSVHAMKRTLGTSIILVSLFFIT